MKDARDGSKMFVKGILPRYSKMQRWPSILKEKSELIKKVNKVRPRVYVKKGPVKSLIGFFGFTKIISSEERDIRTVYDTSKCG